MGCIIHAQLPPAASSASLCKGKGWRNSGFVTVDGPFRRTGTQIYLQQSEAPVSSQLGAISLVAGGLEST